MKKIITILFMGLLAAAVFAETEKKTTSSFDFKTMPMYAKLEAGYSGGMPVEVLTYSNSFSIKPVFGVTPFQNIPRLSFEASFGLDFGGFVRFGYLLHHGDFEYNVLVNRITPMVGALWNISSFNLFDLYIGLGMGVTIQFLNDPLFPDDNSTDAGFVLEALLGAKFKITERIAANAEFYIAVPGVIVFGIRAGATYRFN